MFASIFAMLGPIWDFIEAKAEPLAAAGLASLLLPILAKAGIANGDATSFTNAAVVMAFTAATYLVHHLGTTTPATPAAPAAPAATPASTTVGK